MKKIYKLLPLFIVALVFSSCGVVKNSGKYHAKEVKNVSTVMTDVYHADMQIDETNKISGRASATYFLFFRLNGDNHFADISGDGIDLNPFSKTSGPKKAAQYKALSSSNSDFIAKPSYTISKRTYLLGLFTQVDVDVSGYGGVYKNFKQIDWKEYDIQNETNRRLVDKLNLNK